jgi:hypothetical protein
MAIIAWMMFSMAEVSSVIASCGFASANVGETRVYRVDQTIERKALTDKLDTGRHDLAAISERRPVESIKQEIQRAQGLVGPALKATRNCSDITISESAKACGPVLTLRQALAEAQKREDLERDIAVDQKALASMPVFAQANPAADTLSGYLGGRISSSTIETTYVALLTLFPTLGGVLLSIGMMLWRPVRRQ